MAHADTRLLPRNKAIVKARREGSASLDELATKYGISRERVNQIAEAGGVDRRAAAEKYATQRRLRKLGKAEEKSSVILMLYIGGYPHDYIAATTGVASKDVRAVLDELVTDKIEAARMNNKTAQSHPNAISGPAEGFRQARDDRYWTDERVREALLAYAREHGSLPTSSQYQKIAPESDWLPSFGTVRNRLGRWSNVRAEIHELMRS